VPSSRPCRISAAYRTSENTSSETVWKIGKGVVRASTKGQEGGIDEDFIKRVGEEVTEGTSALFVLTSGAEDRGRVAEEMRSTYDFEVIWTNLPDEQLEKPREVFAS
jgi:uncharacterized membrane protein